EVEAAAFDNFIGDVDHIAQHRKQVLLDAPDHLPIDEGAGRRIVQLQPDTPGLAADLQVEVAVALEDQAGIVQFAAGVQHGQGAAAEQRVQTALPGIQELVDLRLGKILKAALGRDLGVDQLLRGRYDNSFHSVPVRIREEFRW